MISAISLHRHDDELVSSRNETSRIDQPLSIRYSQRLNYEKLLMEPAGIIAEISFHFLETEAREGIHVYLISETQTATKTLGEVNFPLIMFEFRGKFRPREYHASLPLPPSPPPLHPNFFINMKKRLDIPFPYDYYYFVSFSSPTAFYQTFYFVSVQRGSQSQF